MWYLGEMSPDLSYTQTASALFSSSRLKEIFLQHTSSAIALFYINEKFKVMQLRLI